MKLLFHSISQVTSFWLPMFSGEKVERFLRWIKLIGSLNIEIKLKDHIEKSY